MKTKTTITELGHNDLVNLFSTALYGSSYLGADCEEAVEHNEKDCFEDILANILLHEGLIMITDYYAEGCVYGSLPYEIDGGENVTYFVTYDDIKRGLERAADGTFNAGDDLIFFDSPNLYDRVICMYEWLIKKGYFNKEYLV